MDETIIIDDPVSTEDPMRHNTPEHNPLNRKGRRLEAARIRRQRKKR